MALMSPTPWNTYVWQFHPILLRTGRTCDSLIFPSVSTYLFLAVLGQLWYMRSRLWHAGPVVVARGILVPWPGIEPTSATLQGRSSTAGLWEKSASDSLLATEIWQRWTGCLNVPTVPFNWLWANPKDNYPRQARLNHVSLPEESLVLLWNKIREMANTASLAGFEERSCHELYSCKEVSPAKSLKNLGSGSFPSQNSRWELSPATTWVFSFVKPWAEWSAKPGPNFRPTETRDNKCVLLKPLGLGQFVIQK